MKAGVEVKGIEIPSAARKMEQTLLKIHPASTLTTPGPRLLVLERNGRSDRRVLLNLEIKRDVDFGDEQR